jgi:hypothetical protein
MIRQYYVRSTFVFNSPMILIMGGERSSTTRMRLAGKICCFCSCHLDTLLWQPPEERACHEFGVEMIRRGNGFRDLACRQAVEHAIVAGRGNIDQLLTPEQYAKLAKLS